MKKNYLLIIYIDYIYVCRKNFYFIFYWLKKWLIVDGKLVVEFNVNINGFCG